MGQTKTPVIRVIPRVFTIILALFLMIFSLDVFQPGRSVQEMAVGFAIHNIPSMLLLVVMFAAWKREWVGAVLFTMLGMVYFIYVPHMYWSAIITITLPLLINGILYQIAWINRMKIPPEPQS